MYGTHAYSIYGEFARSRAAFWRFARFLFLVSLGILLARHLFEIPFSFMEGLSQNLMAGEFSQNLSFKQMALENDLVQAVVVFLTGLITVFVTFFKALRQLLFSK
ncbi:hypothetical protein [Enterococcus casseliflavus]|uniref:hypothetical protein n=1 Tax=Enterococcus casseliflavus TaxID=37734 RepID=UPI0023315A86|nr:hypothetical protein [Enterococcus casseliflavus]MDB1689902.1 hypothetical protein [Enterococcus casseliflavus]